MSKQNNKLKILLIGYKSFLQQNLYEYLKKKYLVKKIRFENFKKYKIRDNDTIINFSYNKNFFSKKYNITNDRNYYLAKLLKNTKSNFILISTRQIYKPKINVTENSVIKPINNYAKNCLYSEKICKKVLRNNLLILRLANVVGLEIGKKKKPSLMSSIITGIKKKKIIFDNNFYIYKDLLPVELFCVLLEKLIKSNQKGTLNLGSGIPIKIDFFLSKIIEKKDIQIEVKIKKNFKDNNFSFKTEKLNKIINSKITKKDLFIYFKRLKKELKKIR